MPELRAGRVATDGIIHHTRQRAAGLATAAPLMGIYDREPLMRRVREFLHRE